MFEGVMDLDLDFETDRISEFLRSKLQEVKSTNAQLENSLQNRQEIASQHFKDIAEERRCSKVEICQVAKKLHNGRYVIGVGIRNESETNLENVNVILDWDSSSPLNYKFHLMSASQSDLLVDGLKWVSELSQWGRIIITLEAPLFTDQLVYSVTGALYFQQNQKKVTLQLPSRIQLAPQDSTDNTIIVQMYKVIDGNIDDFLACVHASHRHEFVMVIPANWSQLLETTLEIDCSLRRINITSNKKFFLAYKISPPLDGALLEIENKDLSRVVLLTTYCRDRNVLMALLHYLHRHIINVVIVPKALYQPDLSLEETTEWLRKSLIGEITALEGFTGGDLVELKVKLAGLEHETDVLMSRINQETK